MGQAVRGSVVNLVCCAVVLFVARGSFTGNVTAESGYTLVWSDEFDAGTAPDAGKWTYDIGGDGWGNHELEYYTKRPENVRIEGGNLVITARRESYAGADGVTRNYTSARLKTQGLFSQTYGRFEARIKLPAGQGIWPAFWMLGENIVTDGWPKCGEIDIMENVGKEPATNHGSLHGPSSTKPTSDLTAIISLPSARSLASDSSLLGAANQTATAAQPTKTSTGAQAADSADGLAGPRLSDDFHVYAVEWDRGAVRFFLDSNLYATFTSAQWPAGGTWVFDHPFFMVLNVAVGGDWPGAPDDSTIFPQQMLVDYVRVYKKSGTPAN